MLVQVYSGSSELVAPRQWGCPSVCLHACKHLTHGLATMHLCPLPPHPSPPHPHQPRPTPRCSQGSRHCRSAHRHVVRPHPPCNQGQGSERRVMCVGCGGAGVWGHWGWGWKGPPTPRLL